MNKRDFIAIGLAVILSVAGFILFGFTQKSGDFAPCIGSECRIIGKIFQPVENHRNLPPKNAILHCLN